ncbi:hypothetical protein V8U11_06240 [Pseudomonas chlororaphis]|uniref:hypothetical protein n=1 Tax=Pseudomonas chlororaphis TaxID=587753 RepID=UPI0030CF10C9
MPESASQHRASAGVYYNKLNDNFRENYPQAQGISLNRSVIPDEICHFGRSIYRVVNSHEELNRPSYQGTAPQQGIVAPLLMLLSQVRLDSSPLPATIDSPALMSGRKVSPAVTGETAPPDNGGDGFSAMLSPVANALYEAGQFISRHDPLKFPATDASPMPLAGAKSTMAAGIARDLKSDSYVITDEHRKNELISSLVQYLVSDGQLTADEGKDFELLLRSEAAGMPILVARMDNEGSTSTREERALVAEKDPRTAEHIKEHCAFEEEVLDAQGENAGKLLLFQAQRSENPFRMIYDNNPNGRPSPEERGVADGLNISADIITLGIKPLIGKLIANAKRRKYYQNQGDEICAERFRRLIIAELATSLDVDGLAFTPRSVGKVKPSELQHALPERERAAFYTFNPNSGIRKEILLELKQGKGSINDNGQKIYLKSTKKPNEFVTYHPYAIRSELLERRVIIDESNLSWRYADSFDSTNLNVEISEGKRQVKLHGNNYELQQNGAGKYEVVVNKESGVKEFIPVYMEPLSRTWHLGTHNGRPAFSNKQTNIIEEIKAKKEEGFYYVPRGNNNQDCYGGGNIYVQKKIGDAGNYPWGRYIEMNGELVPVRNTEHQGAGVLYEVYDVKNPSRNGHPVEWDGNRWLFERKTSAHVSKKLKNIIDPKMFSEKVEAGSLTAPDHQGLRYDIEGNGYIKINGEYIRTRQRGENYFIRKNNGESIHLERKKGKFYPESFRSRISRLRENGLNGKNQKSYQLIAERLNISEDEAVALIRKYEFPAESKFYTENTFALEIKDSGKIPDWAKSFEKLDSISYVSSFKGEESIENGLVRFSGSDGYFYRVDGNPPEVVLESGFRASDDYTAIEKMIPENEAGVIVAGDLQGALRYNTLAKLRYVYKIKGDNIRGVSLKDNLMKNQDKLKLFLGEPIEKKYHTLESLAEDCNGAIYLDEIHLYQKDIRVEDISLLSKDEMQAFLAEGPWKKYL